MELNHRRRKFRRQCLVLKQPVAAFAALWGGSVIAGLNDSHEMGMAVQHGE